MKKDGYDKVTITSDSSATFQGVVNVLRGTLELYDTGNLGDSTDVALSSGTTLLITGGTHGLGSINGNGNGSVIMANIGSNGTQLTIDSANVSVSALGAATHCHSGLCPAGHRLRA